MATIIVSPIAREMARMHAAEMPEKLAELMDSTPVQRIITALILINAAILGLLTSADIVREWGWLLLPVDIFILTAFVIELALRFAARGIGLLRDPWAVFDCLVVGIALVPASGPFAVLRALRDIPPGRVSTYGTLAALAGYPRHARHVGALLGRLPAELALPWFRVVGSGGRIARPGSEGADYQRLLLQQDGIELDSKGRVDLFRYGWPPAYFLR